jgi:hypothetical protein
VAGPRCSRRRIAAPRRGHPEWGPRGGCIGVVQVFDLLAPADGYGQLGPRSDDDGVHDGAWVATDDPHLDAVDDAGRQERTELAELSLVHGVRVVERDGVAVDEELEVGIAELIKAASKTEWPVDSKSGSSL